MSRANVLPMVIASQIGILPKSDSSCGPNSLNASKIGTSLLPIALNVIVLVVNVATGKHHILAATGQVHQGERLTQIMGHHTPPTLSYALMSAMYRSWSSGCAPSASFTTAMISRSIWGGVRNTACLTLAD